MQPAQCFDEMYASDGSPRSHYVPYADWLKAVPTEQML